MTPAASPTSAPAATLADQIGVRGNVPDADYIALAARFGKTQGRTPAAKPFIAEGNVGDVRDFFVTRITGAAIAQTAPPEIAVVTATLRARSAHAYFFFDNVLEAPADEIDAAAAEFEASVWPVVTGVFGEPATPGVDGDPRIIVLQADLGGAVGGYVSGDDVYLRAVRPYSNEAEMLYLDRTLRAGGSAFSVVLAHELQHVIHQHNDGGEEAWLNEGLSETSAQLVGGAVSSIGAFEANPSTQLNTWSSQGSGPHYGAGAAFLRYVADRCGGDAVLGRIAREPRDGAAGIDAVAPACTSPGVSFVALFSDWIAANLLNSAQDPRYSNPTRSIEPRVDFTLAPGDIVDGAAHQFGTDYFQIDAPEGEYVLRFDGADRVDVLPVLPQPGGGMWWSNQGDEIDAALTYELDLTAATDPLLRFRLWHDIERWYDWAYVAVSADDGVTWAALPGDYTGTDDPVATAFGPGYTGTSGDGETPAWLDESVSLAAYAGRKVLLRFEYVTDGSTYGEGLAIDALDVSGVPGVAALQPRESAGWVRLDGSLPQTFAVRLVAEAADGSPVVRDVPLDASSDGELRFDATGLRNVVVAVAGTTEGTNQLASYSIELAQP